MSKVEKIKNSAILKSGWYDNLWEGLFSETPIQTCAEHSSEDKVQVKEVQLVL